MTELRQVTLSAIAGVMLVTAVLSAHASEAPSQTVSPITREHELLKKDVGTWDTAIRIWTAIDAKPIVSHGLETSTLLPGGLWLITHFEGEMAGVHCVGAGTWGYDPVEKKYVGTWVDSMTPHIIQISGEYDPATKIMTHTTKGRDGASGKEYTRKSTLSYLDDGSRLVDAYTTGPDGKRWKMMEVKYTRHKE